MVSRQFTLEDAHALAVAAHTGQVDKLGVDYMEHVLAVADGLADYDLELQIAAMLHDVVEDGEGITLESFGDGVSERALAVFWPWCPITFTRACPMPRSSHGSRRRMTRRWSRSPTTPTTRGQIEWLLWLRGPGNPRRRSRSRRVRCCGAPSRARMWPGSWAELRRTCC